MSHSSVQAPCPTCGALVPWTRQNRWRPFCSERCRLIDLGEWLDEGHRIPGEESEEEGAPFLGPDEEWPSGRNE